LDHYFIAIDTEVWVTRQQPIKVSDKERSIFDGLRQPEYAPGIPEVAKALWMTRSEIKLNRLLDYAHRFDNGALTRRLGFLLELYKVAPSRQLERLRTKLTSTYDRLDPTLPKSGAFQARWRLQLNIDKAELEQFHTHDSPTQSVTHCKPPVQGPRRTPIAFQRKLLIIIGHVVMYAYFAFLIGWLVPLGLGIYRLGQR
jgi:hypothetical protein